MSPAMMTKNAACTTTGSEPNPAMPSSSVTTPVTSSTVSAPRNTTSAGMRVRAIIRNTPSIVVMVIQADRLSPRNMI